MRAPRPKFLAKPRYRFPKRAYQVVKRRKMTLTVLTLFYTYFILMGGIYDIVNKVPRIGFTSNGLTVVYQSLSHQFAAEGMIAAFMFFMAALGLWLMEASVKYIDDPHKSMTYSMAGLTLLIVAIATVEYMMSLKT